MRLLFALLCKRFQLRANITQEMEYRISILRHLEHQLKVRIVLVSGSTESIR